MHHAAEPLHGSLLAGGTDLGHAERACHIEAAAEHGRTDTYDLTSVLLAVNGEAAPAKRGTQPVIPPNPIRKHLHSYDADVYKQRNLIKRMFCSLKDFRRIATRYDKRADSHLSAILIAAAITWWAN